MLKEVIKINHLVLFIDEKGKWFCMVPELNKIVDLEVEDNLITILIIFKENPDEFFEKINNTLEKYNSTVIQHPFPINRLLIFAINNHLNYWINLASAWANYFDKNDIMFKEKILMIQKENYPQSIKHSLIKILNKS